MARIALPLLLVAGLTVGCAGFQKGPDPVPDQLQSIRLTQLGLESRLANVEARLAEIAPPRAPEARSKEAAPKQPAGAGPATEAKAPAVPAQAATATEAPAKEPDPAEAAYEKGLALLRDAHQPREARAAFAAFLKEHPKHALAPNALYWSGECLYDLKEYADAIPVFKEVAVSYPQHPKAAAALLKMGYSYLGLEDTANARDYLGRVEKLYPGSDVAPLAKAALERLNAPKAGEGAAEAGKEDKP